MQERFDLLQLFLTVFMMLDAVFDAGAQMIAEDICVRQRISASIASS